jgi:Leucine-rich repeat (LRR) protein
MHGNHVESLDGFEELRQLSVLVLSDNRCKSLQPIEHLCELIHLNASKNKLTDVDMSQLIKLKQLCLNENSTLTKVCVFHC